MSTSDSQFRLIKFLGFSGVASLVGVALMFGRYQSSIDAALNKQAETQQQLVGITQSIVTLTEAVHMNQYRINEIEKQGRK